jgi:hypothetical protein
MVELLGRESESQQRKQPASPRVAQNEEAAPFLIETKTIAFEPGADQRYGLSFVRPRYRSEKTALCAT